MNRVVFYSLTLLLIVSLSLTTAKTDAQEITVNTRFDTTTAIIGDHVTFTVETNAPNDVTVVTTAFYDTLTAGIDVLSGPHTDTLQSDIKGRSIIAERYVVTAFDSGRYEVSPVMAEIKTESGIKRFYSDYAYLIVNRPEIDPPDTETGFFDIAGPYNAPLTLEELLPWILITAALAIALWFLIRYLLDRRRQREGIVPDNPMEPPHVIAYRSLEKLKNEKLWQKGLYKEYFTRLSDILRLYIDNRFNIHSMESTTGEILTDMDKNKFAEGDVLEYLKQALLTADMVKFAKYVPDRSDCELSMEHSWNFVSQTRREKKELSATDNEHAVENSGDDTTKKGGELCQE